MAARLGRRERPGEGSWRPGSRQGGERRTDERAAVADRGDVDGELALLEEPLRRLLHTGEWHGPALGRTGTPDDDGVRGDVDDAVGSARERRDRLPDESLRYVRISGACPDGAADTGPGPAVRTTVDPARPFSRLRSRPSAVRTSVGDMPWRFSGGSRSASTTASRTARRARSTTGAMATRRWLAIHVLRIASPSPARARPPSRDSPSSVARIDASVSRNVDPVTLPRRWFPMIRERSVARLKPAPASPP